MNIAIDNRKKVPYTIRAVRIFKRESGGNSLVTILHKSCEWCHLPFVTTRPDARFHSDACRAAASRQRRRYAAHEPIPGLRGDFALAADWLYKCSPEAFRVVVHLRRKRGLRAAQLGIVAALACCFPGIEELPHEHHGFYSQLIDRELSNEPYPNGNLATGV